MAAAGASSEMPADDVSDVASQLRTMRQLIARLTALNLDPTEYACLKAIVLFKPGVYILMSLNIRRFRSTVILSRDGVL